MEFKCACWRKKHAEKRRAAGQRDEQELKEITYAVAEDGRYVRSRAWPLEPKHIANAQAWEVITEDVKTQARLVRDGKRGPFAYIWPGTS